MIPKSGPRFNQLEPEKRADLRRLHQNLGHPDPVKMMKFLKERGAETDVVQAAGEMQCDVLPRIPGKTQEHSTREGSC